MTRATSVTILFALVACACSSSTPSQPAAPASDAGSAADSEATETGSQVTLPTTFGSYVVLGDSISDKGGGAQTGPFYRDLLYQNDDTRYPAWKGLTLKDKFGVTQYVPKAAGGSVTKDLLQQLGTVPAQLPTPILVTVTSGGNDLSRGLYNVLFNPPAAEADAKNAANNVDAFLQSIEDKYPGQVYVLQGDIYDPSGGTGNFDGCQNIASVDKRLDQSTFGRWNELLHAAIAKHPSAVLAPLHDTFMGHELHASESWFYTDCIHPTTGGQHQIRRMMWKLLTGQDGPA